MDNLEGLKWLEADQAKIDRSFAARPPSASTADPVPGVEPRKVRRPWGLSIASRAVRLFGSEPFNVWAPARPAEGDAFISAVSDILLDLIGWMREESYSAQNLDHAMTVARSVPAQGLVSAIERLIAEAASGHGNYLNAREAFAHLIVAAGVDFNSVISLAIRHQSIDLCLSAVDDSIGCDSGESRGVECS